MELKVLIKWLDRAIRSGDVRAMDYRADKVREYLRRHAAWS